MPNLTISLPEELHELVKRHRKVNWSEVCRLAIRAEVRKLELIEELVGAETLARFEEMDEEEKLAYLDKLAEDSQLTEEDIDELDHIIKRRVLRHYLDR